LTELSDASARYLGKHRGYLDLCGLTSLSDAAAESLSKHNGYLYLSGLTELSEGGALQLASHNSLETNAKIKRKIKKDHANGPQRVVIGNHDIVFNGVDANPHVNTKTF
jgi:hypothetical protein